MKTGILLLASLFVISPVFAAQEISQQVLNASLPQVLEISKIIVETSEYDRDMPLANVRIRSANQVNKSLDIVGLSPIRVKLHTNMGTPITISASFNELKHVEGKYDFVGSDLSFTPESYTINNPYDNIITDEFIPTMNVRPDAVKGIYTGKVTFTLGAV